MLLWLTVFVLLVCEFSCDVVCVVAVFECLMRLRGLLVLYCVMLSCVCAAVFVLVRVFFCLFVFLSVCCLGCSV